MYCLNYVHFTLLLGCKMQAVNNVKFENKTAHLLSRNDVNIAAWAQWFQTLQMAFWNAFP